MAAEINALAKELDDFVKLHFPFEYGDADGSLEETKRALVEHPLDVVEWLLETLEDKMEE